MVQPLRQVALYYAIVICSIVNGMSVVVLCCDRWDTKTSVRRGVYIHALIIYNICLSFRHSPNINRMSDKGWKNRMRFQQKLQFKNERMSMNKGNWKNIRLWHLVHLLFCPSFTDETPCKVDKDFTCAHFEVFPDQVSSQQQPLYELNPPSLQKKFTDRWHGGSSIDWWWCDEGDFVRIRMGRERRLTGLWMWLLVPDWRGEESTAVVWRRMPCWS